jgi:hypothetical protein
MVPVLIEVLVEAAAGSGLTSGNEVDITPVDDGFESVEGTEDGAEELLCAATSTTVELVVADVVAYELAVETDTEEKEMLVGWSGFTPTA